jgi:SAM-dependent methyltransferase
MRSASRARPIGASVLDLCCGVGRHSIELARRGFRVTAVDRDAKFLEQARDRAEAQGLAIEFVQADMRQFHRPAAFEAAISFWTSFGYFEEETQNRAVLENLNDSLRPGGRLLMELMGKEVIARIFQPRRWQEHGDTIVCEDCRAVDGWRYCETRWVMISNGQRKEFPMRVRCFSAVELGDLLRDCGFENVQAFGDLGGAPYDHEAKRLIVTARRPEQ